MNNLLNKIKKASFIWIAGNGGSASCAEHFATDLVKKGYSAISLTSNTSLITMLANDYGYQTIFSKQLEIFASPDDLLITISCSGTSGNVVEAIRVAKEIGVDVYKFEIFKKGDKKRDFGKLENEHLMLAHKIAKKL